MTTPIKVLIVLAILFLAWVAWGYFSVRSIEQPPYELLSEKDGIEVRQYDSYIVAETTLEAGYREGLNSGFMVVADYIFGNNTKQTDIAMTAPVISEDSPAVSEEIAMTTPVFSEEEGEKKRTIGFVMPSKYTAETLPKPNNDAVTIREVPAQKVAVLRFSGWATEAKVERYRATFLEKLQEQGFEVSGKPRLAQYNPPWTPPFMRRNEFMIDVQD